MISNAANTRVFISYSHDNRAHCDRVLELAQQLRRDGIAAELDQFHQEELLHWPRWCEEQMRPENADFVLCVCTAEYARRVENRTAADVGKGVFWEGKLIYDELYDAKGNPRCVPVLLGGVKDVDIPRVLKNYTWFRLDGFGLDDAESGYAKLFRVLTRQAGVNAETLGKLVALPSMQIQKRLTDFGKLIHDIRDGLIDIQQDTQDIRRKQAEHGALLERIELSAHGYRCGALHQLKSPPEHFTGRAQVLAELCEALREQARVGGAVGLSAVNGMGGVGKTALALMVGQTLREDFPDMQLFLELRTHSNNPASAGQARDTVLLAINPEARLPDDEDARWRLYTNLFHDAASGKTLRALVVVDDAKDDEQVRLLSPPPGCALLVTSRQQLQTGCSFHLDRLPRAEAMALLRAYAPRLTDEQASHLAELCCDLPVALKTSGGFLKQYCSKPAEEYLDELQRDRLRRLSNKSQPNEDVNLVFDYNYRDLEESERLAWTALSIMPASFDRSAGRAVIDSVILDSGDSNPPPDTGELLDRVVCLNLLDYDEERERHSWQDLLREFAFARLPMDKKERARLGHAEHFIEAASQANELYKQGNEHLLQGLALFDQERAHLEAAFGFLQGDARWSGQLLRLVDGVAYAGELRFHPRMYIHWLEAQAAAARQTGNWQFECSALGNMGNAYFDLGESRKAIDYHERCLDICRKMCDLRGEGKTLGNLGNVYAVLGEPRKAIGYYEQDLAIARAFGDQQGMSDTIGNIGNIYSRLGEPHKAIDYHEQDLAIRRAIGDRPGEGIGCRPICDSQHHNSLIFF